MSFSVLVKEGEEYKKILQKTVRLLKESGKLGGDRERNLTKLSRKQEEISGLLAQLDQRGKSWRREMEGWLEEENAQTALLIERRQNRLIHDLVDAFSRNDLVLTGTVPLLRVGVLTVEVNLEKSVAVIWFGPKQERLGRVALSPGQVVDKVMVCWVELGCELSEDEFMLALNESVTRLSAFSEGSEIPLVSLLVDLSFRMQSSKFQTDPRKENFREYSRADFACDLFRFRKKLLDQYQLVVATRAFTRRRKDFLWIPDTREGAGTAYSHLRIPGEGRS